jgi:hypothetical protein
MLAWLASEGVADVIPKQHVCRAYLAFSRCPFGPEVMPQLRRKFFLTLAPWVAHLAIEQLDMGKLHNPKYEMSLQLRDLTPICQPPMRVTPEVESWLQE